MIEKLKKNILVSISLAAVIYLILSIFADYHSVINSFSRFNFGFLPLLLLLSYLNYVTRFFKWHYYLNLLKIRLPLNDSYSIFMSGLVMSITPGKMGELLKSYLVKKAVNEPVSKTAPIVVVERITDFISLALLSLTGAYVFDYGKEIVAGSAAFFFILIFIIGNKKLSLRLLYLFSQIRFLKKFSSKLTASYESSYVMLRPGPLTLMILLSSVSWFFECLGFYFVLLNFNIDVSVFWSAFAYGFATIVGSLSMLPGGLGATEGSLALLLIEHGVTKELAIASTFIIRVVTLWFALFVGVVSLVMYQKRIGKLSSETLNN